MILDPMTHVWLHCNDFDMYDNKMYPFCKCGACFSHFPLFLISRGMRYVCFLCIKCEETDENNLLVILDAMAHLWRQCNNFGSYGDTI